MNTKTISTKRNEVYYRGTETAKRIQPQWVEEIDQQVAEFLSKGGKVQEIPIGTTAVNFALSRKDRAAFCAHAS